MSALQVRGLRVARGGRRVLDGVELDAPDGVCTVIVGEAGAGLTTLAAALAGTLPSQGRVLLGDAVCSGPPSARLRRGLMVSSSDLAPVRGCSVTEALRLACGDTARVAATLERFPLLGSRAGLDTSLLSGGEQQLLRLACVWARRPGAAVLDSPAVGIAEALVADVVGAARELAEHGAAVVWMGRRTAPAPAEASWELAQGRLSPAASAPLAGWPPQTA